jgi:hypothetical protein
METMAFRSKGNGIIPMEVPHLSIGAYMERDDENRRIVFVYVMKLKSEESTFAALQRALAELEIDRSEFRAGSWYAAGFAQAGCLTGYEVATLNIADDGGLELNAELTTPGAGGKSLRTAEGLLKELLNIDVDEVRQTLARKKAEAAKKK